MPTPFLFRTSWLMLFTLACTSAPVVVREQPPRNKLANVDDFGALLVDAGLPTEDLPRNPELSAAQANELKLRLSLDWPKRAEEAPRMVASLLLEDVLRRKTGTVSRRELSQRLRDFDAVYMMRRDGCFARALSGKAEQCVGPVEVREGQLRAGAFIVDRFYTRDARNQWQPALTPAPPAVASRQ
ncbi:hypothetical protein [Archangium primigenium]|uniref:hypothetical protein n=1 Tax=[Archangium] primigenium TaxID=2792470 RepID=UPI00195CCB19|nr:hypothetical protein [Archangium primigenium]MBM7115682.1 hypothetical protein [Archangium primigenium]